MANFKAWVELTKAGNYLVRHRDGKTKLPSGRWKTFNDYSIDKTESKIIRGEKRTGKWLAHELKDKVLRNYYGAELGEIEGDLPIEPLIKSFLNDCRNAGLSPTTIENYEFDLHRFNTEGQCLTLADLTVDKIKAWRDLMCTYLAHKTVRGRMVTAHTFCVWLQGNEKIIALPFRKKMMPKVKRGGPKYYEVAEWIKLDDAAAKINPEARLAFNLCYALGLRLVEVAGNKYRKGILWEDLRVHSDGTVWLTIRPEIAKGGATAGLFKLDSLTISLLGSWRHKSGTIIKMSRRQLWHLFTRCRKMAGNPKLTIHRLRHSFVKNVLERGQGDLKAAQEAARHSDVRTTQIYAHHEKSHVTKVLDLAHEKRIQEEALIRREGQNSDIPQELVIEPESKRDKLRDNESFGSL